jgi:hypothetical protein
VRVSPAVGYAAPSLAGGPSSAGGSPEVGMSSSSHQPTSCQAPSFQPMRLYTPTSTKPQRSWSATLASLGSVIPAIAT